MYECHLAPGIAIALKIENFLLGLASADAVPLSRPPVRHRLAADGVRLSVALAGFRLTCAASPSACASRSLATPASPACGTSCARTSTSGPSRWRRLTGATPTTTKCPTTAQMVRLVRHVASTGKVRVLVINLLDPAAFPAHEFGDIYHQRWRIEEAFKRLKHRLNFEHVSGLSQQPRCMTSPQRSSATTFSPWPRTPHCARLHCRPHDRINRAAAPSSLKPLLPALLLGADITVRLLNALQLTLHGPIRTDRGLSNRSHASRARNHTSALLKSLADARLR